MIADPSKETKYKHQSRKDFSVFTYLTEAAILNANGAWYAVDAVTSRTDWEASDTGPMLPKDQG